MPASTSDSRFAQLVQKMMPGAQLLRAWSLPGGISASMTALELENPGGERVCLVLRRPGVTTFQQDSLAAETEFKCLQLVHSLGLPVPRPVYLDATSEIFPAPYLVVEYIAGSLDFAPADLPAAVIQMAELLARLHRADLSRLDTSFLKRQPPGCAGELAQPAGEVDPAFDVQSIRLALEASPPEPPAPSRQPPTLLHGDYWPGNILWQGAQLAAVIDWEDASLGDPLSDLAISRLDILCIFGSDAMQAFTARYFDSNPIDPSRLPYWDLCAVLRLARLAGSDLAAWAAFFHPFGRTDITAGTLREHVRQFSKPALEKLLEL